MLALTIHDALVAAGVVIACVFVLYLVGKATQLLLKLLVFLILLLALGAAAWWFFLGGREEFQKRQRPRMEQAALSPVARAPHSLS